jgi:hypothetical protein
MSESPGVGPEESSKVEPNETAGKTTTPPDTVSKSIEQALQIPANGANEEPEVDDFGLPIKKFKQPVLEEDTSDEDDNDSNDFHEAVGTGDASEGADHSEGGTREKNISPEINGHSTAEARGINGALQNQPSPESKPVSITDKPDKSVSSTQQDREHSASKEELDDTISDTDRDTATEPSTNNSPSFNHLPQRTSSLPKPSRIEEESKKVVQEEPAPFALPLGVSEFSHQQSVPKKEDDSEQPRNSEDEWQTMPAFAPFDIYDDNNKLVAREHDDAEDDKVEYGTLGGAGKGYTRINIDEDAQSATSLDDNTNYLFKGKNTEGTLEDEEEETRNVLGQLEATKELLSEVQKIAYVGIARLAMATMTKRLSEMPKTKKTKKEIVLAEESMKMWGQKMMLRLYTHMEISPAGQRST